MPHDPSDVLSSVYARLSKLERINPQRAKAERRELDLVLSGKATIERSMLCKNCKWYVKMIGKLKILKNTEQLERTFHCTECRLVAHIDYIQMPKIQAFRILVK